MSAYKFLVALAALTAASGASAANFLAYTFTGTGNGMIDRFDFHTGNERTFIPLGFFSTTLYVSLDTGSNCEGGGGSSGGCYEGNGVDTYFILGPAITETNQATLSGGTLSIFDKREYPTIYNIDLSASFSGNSKSFAELGKSGKFLGGGLSYSNFGRRYSEQFHGNITGFSVRSVDGPGEVNVTFQAVPEPSTWVLTIAGFAMLGAALRYRRRGSTLAYA